MCRNCGGIGQWWPTTNSWKEGEKDRKEEKIYIAN